jgi:hypothetical protein
MSALPLEAGFPSKLRARDLKPSPPLRRASAAARRRSLARRSLQLLRRRLHFRRQAGKAP